MNDDLPAIGKLLNLPKRRAFEVINPPADEATIRARFDSIPDAQLRRVVIDPAYREAIIQDMITHGRAIIGPGGKRIPPEEFTPEPFTPERS